MSTTRTIYLPDGELGSTEHVKVTRYSRGREGLGLQLTIGERFCQLSPAQRAELFNVLAELYPAEQRPVGVKGWVRHCLRRR